MTDALSAPGGAIPSTADGLARNPAQLLSTRLLKVKLDDIARAIDKDETAACRVRSNERPCTLSEFCSLLTLGGLKLVDREKVCVDRRAYESMTFIASRAMANAETAKTLIWDEDQG